MKYLVKKLKDNNVDLALAEILDAMSKVGDSEIDFNPTNDIVIRVLKDRICVYDAQLEDYVVVLKVEN